MPELSMQIRILTSTADPMFIVDAGASHHMVADKKLSTSLQSIPTKQIVIGDGSRRMQATRRFATR